MCTWLSWSHLFCHSFCIGSDCKNGVKLIVKISGNFDYLITLSLLACCIMYVHVLSPCFSLPPIHLSISSLFPSLTWTYIHTQPHAIRFSSFNQWRCSCHKIQLCYSWHRLKSIVCTILFVLVCHQIHRCCVNAERLRTNKCNVLQNWHNDDAMMTVCMITVPQKGKNYITLLNTSTSPYCQVVNLEIEFHTTRICRCVIL